MKKNLITAGTVLGVLAFLLIEASGRQSDFNLYMRASVDLFRGGDIYTINYFEWYHYYYSLLFAVFMVPFSYLPIPLAQFLWASLNAFFVYRIIRIVGSWLNTEDFKPREKWLFFVLCFAFALYFILLNFNYGQVTICILYLSLEGLRLVFDGNKFWGAILIALGINIKLMPLVLLPYLIYRKEFKASAIIIAAYCAFLILPGFVVGFARNNALLASWGHSINPLNTRHVLDVDERSFHSLSTLLATLLVEKVPDHFALPIKRNIANISVEQLNYVLNTVRLMLILLAFYFFRSKPFTVAKSGIQRFWEISYLLLIVPLIFPHQQQYAFLFVVPAACYIIYYLFNGKTVITRFKFRALLASFIIAFLACNCSLLLGEFNRYYEHFKVLTYGALLLIPILAAATPLQGKPAIVQPNTK